MSGEFAQELLGVVLVDGWVAVERIDPGPEHTGGTFSVGYVVQNSAGARAFCKALDYSAAFDQPDTALALAPLVEMYNFERDLLLKCSDRRMDRIVRILAHGSVRLDANNQFSVVQYLIFELADGDVRRHLRLEENLDLAWALRCLHSVAVGLTQLHRSSVVHQDLKPSNVMVFDRTVSKIGDLGRATDRSRTMWYDELPCAGARTYAPPELSYGFISDEWAVRRVACDVYHLGSMLLFLMSGVGTTPAVLAELPIELWPENWSGRDYEEVLPFVRSAFSIVADRFEQQLPDSLATEIAGAFRELCEPDPRLRGHPDNRRGNRDPYSLEQYVTMFNRLALKSEAAVRLRPVA